MFKTITGFYDNHSKSIIDNVSNITTFQNHFNNVAALQATCAGGMSCFEYMLKTQKANFLPLPLLFSDSGMYSLLIKTVNKDVIFQSKEIFSTFVETICQSITVLDQDNPQSKKWSGVSLLYLWLHEHQGNSFDTLLMKVKKYSLSEELFSEIFLNTLCQEISFFNSKKGYTLLYCLSQTEIGVDLISKFVLSWTQVFIGSPEKQKLLSKVLFQKVFGVDEGWSVFLNLVKSKEGIKIIYCLQQNQLVFPLLDNELLAEALMMPLGDEKVLVDDMIGLPNGAYLLINWLGNKEDFFQKILDQGKEPFLNILMQIRGEDYTRFGTNLSSTLTAIQDNQKTILDTLSTYEKGMDLIQRFLEFKVLKTNELNAFLKTKKSAIFEMIQQPKGIKILQGLLERTDDMNDDSLQIMYSTIIQPIKGSQSLLSQLSGEPKAQRFINDYFTKLKKGWPVNPPLLLEAFKNKSPEAQQTCLEKWSEYKDGLMIFQHLQHIMPTRELRKKYLPMLLKPFTTSKSSIDAEELNILISLVINKEFDVIESVLRFFIDEIKEKSDFFIKRITEKCYKESSFLDLLVESDDGVSIIILLLQEFKDVLKRDEEAFINTFMQERTIGEDILTNLELLLGAKGGLWVFCNLYESFELDTELVFSRAVPSKQSTKILVESIFKINKQGDNPYSPLDFLLSKESNHLNTLINYLEPGMLEKFYVVLSFTLRKKENILLHKFIKNDENMGLLLKILEKTNAQGGHNIRELLDKKAFSNDSVTIESFLKSTDLGKELLEALYTAFPCSDDIHSMVSVSLLSSPDPQEGTTDLDEQDANFYLGKVPLPWFNEASASEASSGCPLIRDADLLEESTTVDEGSLMMNKSNKEAASRLDTVSTPPFSDVFFQNIDSQDVDDSRPATSDSENYQDCIDWLEEVKRSSQKTTCL